MDDELDEIGILLVSTPDEEVAQEHGEDTFANDVMGLVFLMRLVRMEILVNAEIPLNTYFVIFDNQKTNC